MRIFSFLLIGLMLVGSSQSAYSQTAPLAAKDKAVVLFDFDLVRLQESALFKMMGLQEQLAQNTTGDIDLSKATRMFGIASAPENIAQFQQMEGGGDVPINFFFRVQFENEAALKTAMDKIAADSTEFSRGGKTYYRPEKDDAPTNICAGQVDSTTMVMGTDTFVFMNDHKAAFSEGLQSAWQSLSSQNDAIRLVVDLEGARDLVNEAVEMGKQQGDPMAQSFLELVPGMNDIRITMDLSGGNLFSLGSNCVDSDAATQLKEALDSIFGIAKMAGGAQLNQLKQQGMTEIATVAEKILRSLKAELDGNSVNVAIPKPEGFETAVQNAAGMFGMGAGPEMDDDDF